MRQIKCKQKPACITRNKQNLLQTTKKHCYLPTPLLEELMVFPPSRERLPSGNMWTQLPLFNFERAKSIPYKDKSNCNHP